MKNKMKNKTEASKILNGVCEDDSANIEVEFNKELSSYTIINYWDSQRLWVRLTREELDTFIKNLTDLRDVVDLEHPIDGDKIR